MCKGYQGEVQSTGDSVDERLLFLTGKVLCVPHDIKQYAKAI